MCRDFSYASYFCFLPRHRAGFMLGEVDRYETRRVSGVLEPPVTATGRRTMDSRKYASFSPALKATKDGVRTSPGTPLLLYLDDGKDHRSETIADAVKAGHFAEFFIFKVNGLADGSMLRVTGLSYRRGRTYTGVRKFMGPP